MTTTCPLLGRETETTATRYTDGQFQLVQCLETGFVFLKDPPSYEEVRDDFPWDVTAVEERTRRAAEEPFVARASSVVKWIKLRISPKRNRMFALAQAEARSFPADRELMLLDIGCGHGQIAYDCCQRFAAGGRAVRPIGVELAPELARVAEPRFAEHGGRVIADSALAGVAQLEENSIDIALLTSFLEHEPQPLDLLRTLRGKLSADGFAVIKVPNFDSLNRKLRDQRWCGFRYPDHVNYFTPRTLRLLAAEAGYQLARDSWALHPPLSDNMYAIIRPADGEDQNSI